MRYYWGWGVGHIYAHEKQDLNGSKDSNASTMGAAGGGIDDPEGGDLMANSDPGGKPNPEAAEAHPPIDNATSGDEILEDASGDENSDDEMSDDEDKEDLYKSEEPESEEEF